MNEKRKTYLLAAGVAVATFAVYLATLRNGFVLWDDDANVIENFRIRSMDWNFFRWAFTDFSMSLWQPLIWISHAIDYALWGLRPQGYHLTNIVLHAGNTALVVLLIDRLFRTPQGLQRASGEGGGVRSNFPAGQEVLVAAGTTGILFGLHPLQVESVAWISSRTGILCVLFFLLSVLAYLDFARSRKGRGEDNKSGAAARWGAYAASLLFGLLSLASKPLAITLPVVLLLLDWRPLGRIRSLKDFASAAAEKVPFFVMSGAVTVAAFLAQAETGNLAAPSGISLVPRALIAAKAIVLYLAKTAAPIHLSPYYPYPQAITAASPDFAFAAVLVAGVTVALLAFPHTRTSLAPAWGYFLITLFPMLGIVKVRSVFMADRYVYLPSVGIFLLVGLGTAWTWSWIARRKQQRMFMTTLAAGAVLVVVVMTGKTLKQIAVWKDTISLWSTVIDQEPLGVPTAYHNRGLAFKAAGRFDRAIEDLSAAISLESGANANTFNSRGLTYKDMKQYDLAIRDFNAALMKDPKFADAYTSRGWTYRDMGQPDRAIEDYDTALSLGAGRHPDILHNNRGMAFQDKGMADEALREFTAALLLNPSFAEAYINRGLAYERLNRPDLAFDDYTAALRANPGIANAYNNRGLLLEHAGRFDEALADFNAAVELNPSGTEAYNNRGLVYEDMGKFDSAVGDYSRAIELDPGDYLAYGNRAIAYEKMGLTEQAEKDRKKAAALRH